MANNTKNKRWLAEALFSNVISILTHSRTELRLSDCQRDYAKTTKPHGTSKFWGRSGSLALQIFKQDISCGSPSTHLGHICFTEISHACLSHLKQHLSKHAFSSEEEKRGRWEYNDKRVWVYLSGCTRMLSTTSSNCSLWSHTHTKWRTVAGITPDSEETQKREEKKGEKKPWKSIFLLSRFTDWSLGLCETLSIQLHLNLKSD